MSIFFVFKKGEKLNEFQRNFQQRILCLDRKYNFAKSYMDGLKGDNILIECAAQHPTDNMYHNYVNEMFGAIPFVLTEDNSWQDNNSNAAINSRNDRCPYLKRKITNLLEMNVENFDVKEYQIDLNELQQEIEMNRK